MFWGINDLSVCCKHTNTCPFGIMKMKIVLKKCSNVLNLMNMCYGIKISFNRLLFGVSLTFCLRIGSFYSKHLISRQCDRQKLCAKCLN